MVKSKLTNFGFKSLQATSCVFEPFEELYDEVTMGDTFLPTLTKHVKLPVHNEGPEDIYSKKGKQLGLIYGIEKAIITELGVKESVQQSAAQIEEVDDTSMEVLSHLEGIQKNQAIRILQDYERRLTQEPKHVSK